MVSHFLPKHIKLNTVDIWVVYFNYTLTLVCLCILAPDYTVKTCLKRPLKKEDQLSLNAGKKFCRKGAFCNPFDLH